MVVSIKSGLEERLMMTQTLKVVSVSLLSDFLALRLQ